MESPDQWNLNDRAALWVGGADIEACAVLPLATDGRPIGVLSIGWPDARLFDFEEITLFDLMAAEIAIGLENARRYEVERRVAATLREHFVHPLPAITGMDLALVSLPASQPELVGGDFHDVFEAHDGRVVAVIGDVMGKGMRAAGLAETVRSAVRALAFFSPAPGKILRDVNRLLLTLRHEEFTSALVVVLDTRTGRARMASAGHPPPALVRDGVARLVEPVYGPVLGTIDASYEATEFSLPVEAVLAMYTDGLIEARRDGELFGEKRVLEVLSEIADGRSESVARGLRDAVLGFAGTLKDDLEIVALRRTRRASP
jgi:serine phosphatase RsbU (regulator of sigma subunit)